MLHSKSGFHDWFSRKVVMEKTAFQTGNLVRRFSNFKQNLSNNLLLFIMLIIKIF